MLSRAVAGLPFLPQSHAAALEAYANTLAQSQASPQALFHTTFLAIYGTIDALLKSLARPPQLVAQIAACRRDAERSSTSSSSAGGKSSSRWPLGILDDARQRSTEERETRARKSRAEAEDLGRELRHTQVVVAGELAGWQELHERLGRRAIRELARGMVTAERMRLEGIQRALRRVRERMPPGVTVRGAVGKTGGGGGGSNGEMALDGVPPSEERKLPDEEVGGEVVEEVVGESSVNGAE